MAKCPLTSWPISRPQSCQPSQGLWVGTRWWEPAFRKEPFYQPAYGSVCTWPHLLALMSQKTNASHVRKKRAGWTSISGISERRTHARLPVGNGSEWMRRLRMKARGKWSMYLLLVCREVILAWRLQGEHVFVLHKSMLPSLMWFYKCLGEAESVHKVFPYGGYNDLMWHALFFSLLST